MPGIDSGSLRGNGIKQLLRGVELGGEDAKGVERESDGVSVRVTGRHCLGIVGGRLRQYVVLIECSRG